jgi:hypothetical protein
MTGCYIDSGVLVRAYGKELNSPEAISLILSQPPPLPLTHLQEAEIRNALRLKVFRCEMSTAALAAALAIFDEDIRAGRLERPSYDALAVYRRAEILSSRYAVTTGARMLDILHVAAALEIKAVGFVSFDLGQRAVAKKAGLKVMPRTTRSE